MRSCEDEEVRDLLREAHRRGAVTASAAATGILGGTVTSAIVGTAACPDRSRSGAVDEDTVFDLASLTKVLSTLPLVLRLVATAQLSVDTPVRDVLESSAAGGVTVRQLLTHTSGLPAALVPPPTTRAEALARVEASSPSASRDVRYSDIGFLVLGQLVERLQGASLEHLLEREVALPLGLRSLGSPHANVQTVETEPDAGGAPWHGVVHDETARALGGLAGHAGLFGSLRDVCGWLQGWHSAGDDWIDSDLRHASMLCQTHDSADPRGHRGWAWVARGDRYDVLGDGWPSSSVSHTGYTGTSIAYEPGSGAYAVLLTNAVHAGRDRAAIRELRAAFHARSARRLFR